jgi:hypothetical protein
MAAKSKNHPKAHVAPVVLNQAVNIPLNKLLLSKDTPHSRKHITMSWVAAAAAWRNASATRDFLTSSVFTRALLAQLWVPKP